MKVSESVIRTLALATVTDDRIQLGPEVLDRTAYVEVNKVIEAMGGKWDKKAKCHLFANQNAAERYAEVMDTQEVVSEKTAFQFFSTPPAVVDILMNEALSALLADRPAILEPSAGEGAIARALRNVVGNDVDVCEIMPRCQQSLIDLGFPLVGEDFLEFELTDKAYDLIVANPPFTRHQDIDHVNHMLDICHSGLVISVMSAGVLFNSDRKATEFRERIGTLRGTFTKLPPNSFKESGTGVATCYVMVQRG